MLVSQILNGLNLNRTRPLCCKEGLSNLKQRSVNFALYNGLGSKHFVETTAKTTHLGKVLVSREVATESGLSKTSEDALVVPPTGIFHLSC